MFQCDQDHDHPTALEAFRCMFERGAWWTIVEVEPNKRAGAEHARIMTIHAAIGIGKCPNQQWAAEEIERTVAPLVRELDRPILSSAIKALRDNEDMDVRVALLS